MQPRLQASRRFVVVDVAVGTRSGVPAANQALALAQLIDTLPNLVSAACSRTTAAPSTSRDSKPASSSSRAIRGSGRQHRENEGIRSERRDFQRRRHRHLQHHDEGAGYHDVQVGSYVFMDAQYLEIGNEKGDIFTDFAPSLTVMTTVVNTYFANRMTTDAGTKALTLNKPDPIVIGEPGFRYTAGSDEFGSIQYDTSNKTYKVGDKLELIIPHCDRFNRYDAFYVVSRR